MPITITSGSLQNYPSGAYFTGEPYGVPEESRSRHQIYQAIVTGSTSSETFSFGHQYQFTIDSNYADGQHFEFETSSISNNLVRFNLRYLDADDPNQQPSYTFRFTAEDRDGETATQEVTVYLKDLDDTAPTITSSNSVSIADNSGAQQVVYTVTSDDTNDVLPWLTTPESHQEPRRPFTKYAFGETGQDNSYFTIDTETGEVTLTDTPDYEEKSEYTFSVVAYDSGDWRWSFIGENYSDEFFVTLTVENPNPEPDPDEPQNPDYALGLSQIPGLSGQARAQKILDTYRFIVPLTTEERQLFEFANFEYMEFVPSEEFLAANPSSDSGAYVGNYLGFPPGFEIQLPVDPQPVDPAPVDPDPNPDPEPIIVLPDPAPVNPDPVQEETPVVVPDPTPVVIDPTPDPVVQFTGGTVFYDATGDIILDSTGVALRGSNINYSADDINTILDNIE